MLIRVGSVPLKDFFQLFIFPDSNVPSGVGSTLKNTVFSRKHFPYLVFFLKSMRIVSIVSSTFANQTMFFVLLFLRALTQQSQSAGEEPPSECEPVVCWSHRLTT